jgi:L-lactate dehydrogenase complex protein LldG
MAGQNALVEAMSNLIATFETNAIEAGAQVERIRARPDDVFEVAKRITTGTSSIVVGAGEFIPGELMEALHGLPRVLEAPTDEQLSRADVGICGGFAGVAAAGSVGVAMGPPLVAMTSLLMPLHIVLLPVSRMVSRPRDLFDPAVLNGEALRRNIVFITGPSATADMGPLTRGVHGPHRLLILLLE